MDNSEALQEDTPVNRMIKKIYSHFDDGMSLFSALNLMEPEYWIEFRRFLDEPSNFCQVAFACWHWSADVEWITKEDLTQIMDDFEQLIETVELGRYGKIAEKNPSPGWNLETEYVIL